MARPHKYNNFNKAIIKEYSADLLARTCRLFDIEQPKIIFTNRELIKSGMQKRVTSKMLERMYGKASKSHYTIWINIDRHESIRELNNTIVHETLHLKDWKLKHGKQFEKLVTFYLNCLFDNGNLNIKYAKY
jgi:hypothetical protein